MRSVTKLGFALTGVALAMLTGSCTIGQSGPGGPRYVSSGTAPLEVNVDRPGGDYRTFDLSSGLPEECRDTCMIEPQCVAFTFVKPGLQGPSARCALKSAVPRPSPSPGRVSGVKSAPPGGAEYTGQPLEAQPGAIPPFELDVDRPGSDLQSLDLPEPRAELCREACLLEPRCQAFTYVNQGVPGPSARCRLKTSAPPPTPSNCCISGVK
jgi:1-phosphatidylinositol phosphodiesterase